MRDKILTRCVNFCRCEWTANKESSQAEAWMMSKCGWEMHRVVMTLRPLDPVLEATIFRGKTTWLPLLLLESCEDVVERQEMIGFFILYFAWLI